MSERFIFALVLAMLCACGTARAAFTPPEQWSAAYCAPAQLSAEPLAALDASLACRSAKCGRQLRHDGAAWQVNPTQWARNSRFVTGTPGSGCAAGGYTSYANKVASSCPANSQLVGGSCVCDAGYEQNATNDGCQVPVPPNECEAAQGEVISGFSVKTASITATPPAQVCSAGCVLTVMPTDITVGYCGEAGECSVGPLSATVTAQQCDETGAAWAPSKVDKEPPPPGMCKGEVNGAPVVVPCRESQTTIKDSSSTGPSSTASSPPGAVPGTSQTTTSTNCEGGQCTTTSTTQTHHGDGTTTTTTSETKAEQADYCAKNPGVMMCQQSSTPAPVAGGSLYADKPRTMTEVFTSAQNTLSDSPIGSAMTGFFGVAEGGSCPDTVWEIPFIGATVSAGVWCTDFAATAFAVIRTVLLLCASFAAFRIAIL